MGRASNPRNCVTPFAASASGSRLFVLELDTGLSEILTAMIVQVSLTTITPTIRWKHPPVGVVDVMAIFRPTIRIVFEMLKFFSLAGQEYLPHAEYQADDHQRNFRKYIQSNRRGYGVLPSIHPNLIPR
jgi:hypothetical protein